MTTQYEISIVRYENFGTDKAERVDILQVGTADAALAGMNLQQMAERLLAAVDAPTPEPETAPEARVRRKRRSDAGQPRTSTPEAQPDASPFAATS